MNKKNEQNAEKCYICGKKSAIHCYNCHKPICESHTYKIKHAAKCPKCTRQEQIKGMVLKWGIIGVLIVTLILIIRFG
ncbi:MAG: hypothetical protein GF364_02460 [Candidatus Lokiarchaeota archaeon]|nr:hypothetical protein [Candidatus Lokiarchaeota archaeon]